MKGWGCRLLCIDLSVPPRIYLFVGIQMSEVNFKFFTAVNILSLFVSFFFIPFWVFGMITGWAYEPIFFGLFVGFLAIGYTADFLRDCH